MKRKKIAMLLVVTLMAGIFSACGAGGNTTGTDDEMATAKELVNDNCNVLIESGSQKLDETLATYSLSSDNLPDVKALADYALFPFNTNSNKSFDQRMKDVLWAEDNVVQIHNLTTSYANDSSGRTVRTKWLMTALKAASTVFDFFKKKRAESATQRWRNAVVRQLNTIGKDLNQFRNETRANFVAIHAKIDYSLGLMQTILGDINFLKQGQSYISELLVTSGIEQVKNSFDAFMISYQNAVDTTDAQTQVENYMGESKNYWQDVLNFINTAKTIQEWACSVQNPEPYSTYVYNDPYHQGDVDDVMFIIDYLEGGTTAHGEDFVRFTNPKKWLPISLGNLQYLAKMIFTKLEMNELLHASDDALKIANSNDAQTCLNLIEEHIKPGVITAASNMHNEYLAHVTEVTNNYTTVIPGLTFVSASYWGYDAHGYLTECSDKNTIVEYITSVYKKQMMQYLGQVVARLAAMEVRLRSYL